MPPKVRDGLEHKTKEGARPQSIDVDASASGKIGSPTLPQASGATGRRGTLRGSIAMPDGSVMGKDELIQKHLEVQERFEALQPINSRLMKDLKKKKESYVRREVFYKSQISHIKGVLEKTVLCRGGNESSKPAIDRMHAQVSSSTPGPQPLTIARAVLCCMYVT